MKLKITVLLLLGLMQITFAQDLVGKIKLRELQKEPYISWYRAEALYRSSAGGMVLKPMMCGVPCKGTSHIIWCEASARWCGNDRREFPHHQSGYDDYKPNEQIIETLNPLFKNVKMKVFLGTWCGDSQRDVPRLGKIFHELGLKKQITWYTIDREKKTKKGYEKGLNITNVPTVIFYNKQGEEINRIVEMSIGTLEEDMLEILTTNNYKDVYK